MVRDVAEVWNLSVACFRLCLGGDTSLPDLTAVLSLVLR